MTKILVADDETDLETLIRQKFRQKIREQQYEFVFATNGKDALEKIQQHPDISIVLSDINMPEMDGLTLLTKLNEAAEYWRTAQDRFEEVFGEPEAAELRAMLSAIAYHPKFGERR